MPTNLATPLAAELRQEAAANRRLLERIAEDRLSWKPHERSMSLGRLAGHLAEIFSWGVAVLERDEVDTAAGDFRPRGGETKEEILAAHDDNVAALGRLLADADDERLLGRWKLRRAEKEIFDLRRIAALRGFVMSHAIHHRGQLTVYLRLLDIPLPQVYGPTADDRGGFGG